MPQRDFAENRISFLSPYKNHSRHERFVESRAIWVLSRIDSLYLVPVRLFFRPRETPPRATKNGASTVVSVFLRARCRRRLSRALIKSISLSWNDVDIAYKRQQRRGPTTRKRTTGRKSICELRLDASAFFGASFALPFLF